MKNTFCTITVRLLILIVAMALTSCTNKNTKFATIQERAKQGDPMAQIILGDMYATGKDVKFFGEIYETGGEVKKDLEKARDLYDSAVKILEEESLQGDKDASYFLALHYGMGDYFESPLVKKDTKKEMDLLERAALQGHSEAQLFIGFEYEMGYNIHQDLAKAFEWYKKSAAQNNETAQYRLGKLYASGKGVPKNGQEAVKWYTKAAKQGDTAAQIELGKLYQNGNGVKQSNKNALIYFKKVCDKGIKIGCDLQDELNANIDSAQ